MCPLSLAKAMIEPAKVIAPIATPRLISISDWRANRAFHADAEGGRRIERGRGDQHRGKADQRMEGRDELRHRGHRDAPRDHRADAAADARWRQRSAPGQRIRDTRDPQAW